MEKLSKECWVELYSDQLAFTTLISALSGSVSSALTTRLTMGPEPAWMRLAGSNAASCTRHKSPIFVTEGSMSAVRSVRPKSLSGSKTRPSGSCRSKERPATTPSFDKFTETTCPASSKGAISKDGSALVRFTSVGTRSLPLGFVTAIVRGSTAYCFAEASAQFMSLKTMSLDAFKLLSAWNTIPSTPPVPGDSRKLGSEVAK